MKVIAICNLPDGIKLDHAWFTAEDGFYAQKVVVRPLPEKMDVEKIRNLHGDEQATCAIGYNACIDEIEEKEN